MKRKPLGRKLLNWLVAYLALVTLAVFGAANYVHEHAEHAVWRALLNSELDSILGHLREDGDYHWQDSDTLSLYRESDPGGLPAELRGLHPGLHDGEFIEDRKSALMVRQTPDLGRVVLVLDIADFAELEGFISRLAMWAGVALAIVTLLMAWVGVGRLVHPLSALARDIGELQPEKPGQRLEVGPQGSAELEVIAAALNDYLRRNEQFVERERTFIGMASHELRTPVAVITGAAGLALEQPGLPERARQQLQRVESTARGMEELIQMLLMLAREPARLAALAEPVALDRLLPEIIADHRHLAAGKVLDIVMEPAPACEILAPPGVVQATFGNLLRNAIENSDRGTIVIRLSAQATVTIDDPGHGMNPEEISQAYAQLARGGRSPLGGLGLDLLGRLCEHLGWTLRFDSLAGAGTRVILQMGASLPPGSLG